MNTLRDNFASFWNSLGNFQQYVPQVNVPNRLHGLDCLSKITLIWKILGIFGVTLIIVVIAVGFTHPNMAPPTVVTAPLHSLDSSKPVERLLFAEENQWESESKNNVNPENNTVVRTTTFLKDQNETFSANNFTFLNSEGFDMNDIKLNLMENDTTSSTVIRTDITSKCLIHPEHFDCDNTIESSTSEVSLTTTSTELSWTSQMDVRITTDAIEEVISTTQTIDAERVSKIFGSFQTTTESSISEREMLTSKVISAKNLKSADTKITENANLKKNTYIKRQPLKTAPQIKSYGQVTKKRQQFLPTSSNKKKPQASQRRLPHVNQSKPYSSKRKADDKQKTITPRNDYASIDRQFSIDYPESAQHLRDTSYQTDNRYKVSDSPRIIFTQPSPTYYANPPLKSSYLPIPVPIPTSKGMNRRIYFTPSPPHRFVTMSVNPLSYKTTSLPPFKFSHSEIFFPTHSHIRTSPPSIHSSYTRNQHIVN